MAKDIVVATHIGDAWEYPDGFRGSIDRYLEEDQPELYAVLHHPASDSYDAAVEPDLVVDSEDGELQTGLFYDLAREADTATIIGGYWDWCHLRAWREYSTIVEDLYRNGEVDSYTVDVPFAYVARRPADVVDPSDAALTDQIASGLAIDRLLKGYEFYFGSEEDAVFDTQVMEDGVSLLLEP